MKPVILFSYSGHAFVVCDILESMGRNIAGYLEENKKQLNPYSLKWLGHESDEGMLATLKKHDYFIGIGSNKIRQKVQLSLEQTIQHSPIKAIHAHAIISKTATIGLGTMINANAIINALAQIGKGVICNTGCIIEHECVIEDFAHIAPGAVLAGNVSIGNRTFVGANAVIKQGISIGKDVTIGAGAVVVKDIPNGVTVVGNPAKVLKSG